MTRSGITRGQAPSLNFDGVLVKGAVREQPE